MDQFFQVQPETGTWFELSFNVPSAEDVQDLRMNRCYITLCVFSRRFTLKLPRVFNKLLKPAPYQSYGFTEYAARKYGVFCGSEIDCVGVYYGIQIWNGSSEQEKSSRVWLNLPIQFEHIRNDAYFLNGQFAFPAHHLRTWIQDHVILDETGIRWSDWLAYPKSDIRVTEHEREFCISNDPYDNYSDVQVRPDDVIAVFKFKDPCDQKSIMAMGYIDEREWIRGKWPWLRAVLKYVPGCRFIRRQMELTFNQEVGARKGSWKGGTIAVGIDMLPGETGNECVMRLISQSSKYLRF